MKIEKVTGAIQAIGLFLLANITGILFLLGLGVICYAIFLMSTVGGFVAIGVSLITVSMILTAEMASGGR